MRDDAHRGDRLLLKTVPHSIVGIVWKLGSTSVHRQCTDDFAPCKFLCFK